jgi:hypothetical protein
MTFTEDQKDAIYNYLFDLNHLGDTKFKTCKSFIPFVVDWFTAPASFQGYEFKFIVAHWSVLDIGMQDYYTRYRIVGNGWRLNIFIKNSKIKSVRSITFNKNGRAFRDHFMTMLALLS